MNLAVHIHETNKCPQQPCTWGFYPGPRYQFGGFVAAIIQQLDLQRSQCQLPGPRLPVRRFPPTARLGGPLKRPLSGLKNNLWHACSMDTPRYRQGWGSRSPWLGLKTAEYMQSQVHIFDRQGLLTCIHSLWTDSVFRWLVRSVLLYSFPYV